MVICQNTCRITAPDAENNQSLCLDVDSGLSCSNNVIAFEVNKTSLLKLKKLYELEIRVGNSAGLGYLTDNLTLSERRKLHIRLIAA